MISGDFAFKKITSKITSKMKIKNCLSMMVSLVLVKIAIIFNQYLYKLYRYISEMSQYMKRNSKVRYYTARTQYSGEIYATLSFKIAIGECKNEIILFCKIIHLCFCIVCII